GSLAAIISGLLWGRQIGLIPPGGLYPPQASSAQVLQRMLQLHEFSALTGLLLGSLCLWFTGRAWRAKSRPRETAGDRRGRHLGRRFWERGVGAPALLISLIWLGAWGFCGKLGGIMVFGSEETNRAAAEAEAKRKNDAETDLPIRALDYASLEPVQSAPFRSQAHGGRWVRTWVPASGIDAYRAGQPLPPGGYAVLSSVEDEQGRPGQNPGPLYFKEVLADGRVAFAFYWPRVPDKDRAETGGEDFVYWRSPEPRLSACATCHRDAGPATAP
ncbi:MAG TPA: hypothetical protein VJ600_09375, partial [Holophagaceae bacterium]|nr:hypothetical protein [Holophagaceae bacterium]